MLSIQGRVLRRSARPVPAVALVMALFAFRNTDNGSLFTGDKSTAKAVSKHVTRALAESGHLQ